jgi:hypothetical protein
MLKLDNISFQAAAIKPKGHRRIHYNRSLKTAATVTPPETNRDIDNGINDIIEVADDTQAEPDTIADELNSDENETIEIINNVYGNEDQDDDFSLDFQNEILNDGKIMEYAKEE